MPNPDPACSNCGSTNLYRYANSSPPDYRCRRCNHRWTETPPPAGDPLACPKCHATEATATYTATVAVIVEDGRLERVIVHDDSAGTCERVRCSGCGYESHPALAAVPATPAGRWVGALLELLDDTNGGQPWPAWQIGSW